MTRLLSTLSTSEIAVYWIECAMDNPTKAREWETLVTMAGITLGSKRWYCILLANAEIHGWIEDIGWIKFYNSYTF